MLHFKPWGNVKRPTRLLLHGSPLQPLAAPGMGPHHTAPCGWCSSGKGKGPTPGRAPCGPRARCRSKLGPKNQSNFTHEQVEANRFVWASVKTLESINGQEATHGAGNGQSQSRRVPMSLLMAVLPRHSRDVLELLGQQQGQKMEDFTN